MLYLRNGETRAGVAPDAAYPHSVQCALEKQPVSAWRRMAIEKLPHLRKPIEESESLGMLWIDLWDHFRRAHRAVPTDDALIDAVYGFARWCRDESHNGDVQTTVMTHFYEELPTDKDVREHIHRFMAKDAFLGTREVFKYHLSVDEDAEFMKEVAGRDFPVRWAAVFYK